MDGRVEMLIVDWAPLTSITSWPITVGPGVFDTNDWVGFVLVMVDCLLAFVVIKATPTTG